MQENDREKLMEAINELWGGNQTEASRALFLSSSRRMREYLSGERNIPSAVWGRIRDIRQSRSGDAQGVKEMREAVAKMTKEMKGMSKKIDDMSEAIRAIMEKSASAAPLSDPSGDDIF